MLEEIDLDELGSGQARRAATARTTRTATPRAARVQCAQSRVGAFLSPSPRFLAPKTAPCSSSPSHRRLSCAAASGARAPRCVAGRATKRKRRRGRARRPRRTAAAATAEATSAPEAQRGVSLSVDHFRRRRCSGRHTEEARRGKTRSRPRWKTGTARGSEQRARGGKAESGPGGARRRTRSPGGRVFFNSKLKEQKAVAKERERAGAAVEKARRTRTTSPRSTSPAARRRGGP